MAHKIALSKNQPQDDSEVVLVKLSDQPLIVLSGTRTVLFIKILKVKYSLCFDDSFVQSVTQQEPV